MNITRDFGEVCSWDEAINAALRLHSRGGVDSVATVSKHEFEGGQYVAMPIDGMGSSPAQVIDNIRLIGPMLYPGNERFRLVLVNINAFHPSYPEKDTMSVLLIVYLKSGEQVEVSVV